MQTPEEKRAKELSNYLKKYKKGDVKPPSLSSIQDRYIKPATVSREVVSETAENIANKLNTLTEAIDPKVIKGVTSKEEMLKYLKELKGNDRIDISNIRNGQFNMSDQRWHGGGIQNITDLIQAGTNVTITGTGTSSDPYIINSSGSGSSITLATNSTLNGDQTLLNLVEGTNMTITDDGLGNITFDVSGGGTVTGTGTDNHIVRWNGTGVPVIQDSDIIISDASAGAITVTSVGDNTLNFRNNGDGYGFDITASNGTTSGSSGGALVFNAGNGSGIGTSAGGTIDINTGDAASGNATGGHFDITTGNGSGTLAGGRFQLVLGNGGATGAGGAITLQSGAGGGTSGAGGQLQLLAGNATAGNSNGGNLILYAGIKSGAGTHGTIQLAGGGSASNALLDISLITGGNKTFTFPNQSGTLMLIPAVPANYTVTNVTTDRTYDADATSTDELADVLGTLISDLTALGLLQ